MPTSHEVSSPGTSDGYPGRRSAPKPVNGLIGTQSTISQGLPFPCGLQNRLINNLDSKNKLQDPLAHNSFLSLNILRYSTHRTFKKLLERLEASRSTGLKNVQEVIVEFLGVQKPLGRETGSSPTVRSGAHYASLATTGIARPRKASD